MDFDTDQTFSPVIAQLIADGAAIIPDRPWSVVSGGERFDGESLSITDGPSAYAVLDTLAATEDGNHVVIWTPIEKRQRGRIPRALRCGYTLATNRHGGITVFQSVVFAPLDVIDIVAHLPSGQVVLVKSQRVSAWDGTSVDESHPLRATS
jgi:hypothetical protein